MVLNLNLFTISLKQWLVLHILYTALSKKQNLSEQIAHLSEKSRIGFFYGAYLLRIEQISNPDRSSKKSVGVSFILFDKLEFAQLLSAIHFFDQSNKVSDIKLKSTVPPFFKSRNVSTITLSSFETIFRNSL